MPEGPEVYNMVEDLNDEFKSSILKDVQIISGRYRKKRPTNYDTFLDILPVKIIGFYNKGKFIWIETNTDWTIWITLGLEGYMNGVKEKYTRLIFDTSKGKIYFDDMRNFGTVHFMNESGKGVNTLEKKLKTLGPDPLHDRITFEYFDNKLSRMNQNEIIADALLNQSLISGIGNYIRAEVLYDAKISPFTMIKDLTTKNRKHLLQSIKDIMKKFKNTDATFKVYRRKRTPNNESVLNKKTKNDRTIYYVEFN